MTLNTFLSRLKKVKKSGAEHRALCPAHDDANPSLSVRERDGKILLNCRSQQCRPEAIVGAVGLTMKDLFLEDAPRRDKAKAAPATIVEAYDYREVDGTLRYQVVRKSDKTFPQRRPTPDGRGWIWDLEGIEPLPYRLPELAENLRSTPDLTIWLVEGEKDANNLVRLGLTATSLKNWQTSFSQYLTPQCRVMVCLDHDIAGYKQALTAWDKLAGVVSARHWLDLYADTPWPAKDGKDVSDWLKEGGTLPQLLDAAKKAPTTAPPSPDGADKDEKSRTTGDGQFGQLQKLLENAEFFHTSEREAWATLPINGNAETLQITTEEFRLWLSHQYYKAHGQMPMPETLQKVLDLSHARALFDGPQHVINTRMAEHDGELWVDLGDASWRAVRLTPTGWHLEAKSPVKFRRPPGLLPLPEPDPHGSLETLRPYINVTPEDFPLVEAWLVAALRPNRPFPVLMLTGGQGSAKSTTSNVLRRLIDPNKSPLRARPKNEEDLVIAATNGWVVTLENVSSLSAGFSDALCRLSTGGGFSKRKLRTDSEETLIDVKRPVLINGINEVITQADLLDRTIMVHLPPLSRAVDERTFWQRFDAQWAHIFGGLLTLGCYGLANLDAVTAQADAETLSLPRLADFTLFGIAAENLVLSHLTDSPFLSRYQGNRNDLQELALEIDQLSEALVRLMHNYRDGWQGKMADLYAEVKKWAPNEFLSSTDFPRNPIALGKRLMRLAPNLRGVGLEYIPIDRSQVSTQRVLTLRWIGRP